MFENAMASTRHTNIKVKFALSKHNENQAMKNVWNTRKPLSWPQNQIYKVHFVARGIKVSRGSVFQTTIYCFIVNTTYYSKVLGKLSLQERNSLHSVS